jgi:hypothetical protein
VALWAFLLSAVYRRETNTAKYVLLRRHGFEMMRVHAARVAAQVIERESCWDGAEMEFVGEAVSPEMFLVGEKLAVSILVRSGHPGPATRCDSDFFPESLFG